MNYFMILSENLKIHELIRVVSRFPRYISRHFEQCNMDGVGGGGGFASTDPSKTDPQLLRFYLETRPDGMDPLQ